MQESGQLHLCTTHAHTDTHTHTYTHNKTHTHTHTLARCISHFHIPTQKLKIWKNCCKNNDAGFKFHRPVSYIPALRIKTRTAASAWRDQVYHRQPVWSGGGSSAAAIGPVPMEMLEYYPPPFSSPPATPITPITPATPHPNMFTAPHIYTDHPSIYTA